MLEGFKKHLDHIAGLAATLVLLGAGFTGLADLPLLVRLLLTGIAALIGTMLLATALARWVRPIPEKPKFGQERDSRKGPRLVLSGIAISGACVLFAGFAYAQTERFIMRLDETVSSNATSAEVFAPLPALDKVAFKLPGPELRECDWEDLRPGSVPQLVANEINWEDPDRTLQIDGFVHPQAIRIECRPAGPIAQTIRVEPPSTRVYLAGQLGRWRTVIVILGGLLWAAAIVRISWSSL